jgi:hypothetical protein
LSAQRKARLAERKALLATRAELDRARLGFAWREARQLVSPAPSPEARMRFHGPAVLLVGTVLPLVGSRRLGRWLRVASIVLVGYRVLRNWRRRTA